MEITKPDPSMFLLPANTVAVTYAEDQADLGYRPLPVLRTPKGAVVSVWQPTANDLLLMNKGVPVSLTLLTFGEPLQPVILQVGGADLREL